MSKGLKPQHKKLLPPKKKCRYCFATENLTYDHKTPLVRGGSNLPSNIQVLCQPCNGTKSSMANGDVWRVARWIWAINESRRKQGKRPLAITKKQLETEQAT
jgi:5-methylcytosine-specific restriction endonuclease McrA